MDRPAAFRARFHTDKAIPSRRVRQIIFEVPEEEGIAALSMLNRQGDVWCAIALLEHTPSPEPAKPEEPKLIEVRREYPLSSKVAMTCQEDTFAEFLSHQYKCDDNPAEFVRGYCQVLSRSEIQPGTDAARRWSMLKEKYDEWRRGWR